MNSKKSFFTVGFVGLICLTAFSLSGCDEDKKALATSPQTQDAGTYEGCTVKYVNRGYDSLSFYIAKCPGEAVTVTKNWMEQQGKTQVFKRTTSITEIDQSLQEARQAVADLEARRNALAKLNDRERKLLGIEEPGAASGPAK